LSRHLHRCYLRAGDIVTAYPPRLSYLQLDDSRELSPRRVPDQPCEGCGSSQPKFLPATLNFVRRDELIVGVKLGAINLYVG
jgi:hypothetical protein